MTTPLLLVHLLFTPRRMSALLFIECPLLLPKQNCARRDQVSATVVANFAHCNGCSLKFVSPWESTHWSEAPSSCLLCRVTTGASAGRYNVCSGTDQIYTVHAVCLHCLTDICVCAVFPYHPSHSEISALAPKNKPKPNQTKYIYIYI